MPYTLFLAKESVAFHIGLIGAILLLLIGLGVNFLSERGIDTAQLHGRERFVVCYKDQSMKLTSLSYRKGAQSLCQWRTVCDRPTRGVPVVRPRVDPSLH